MEMKPLSVREIANLAYDLGHFTGRIQKTLSDPRWREFFNHGGVNETDIEEFILKLSSISYAFDPDMPTDSPRLSEMPL